MHLTADLQRRCGGGGPLTAPRSPWPRRAWQAVARVPLAVSAVAILTVTLVAVGVVAAASRPDGDPAVTPASIVPADVSVRVALPSAVDASGRPGPAPASLDPRGAVATTGGDVTIGGVVTVDGEPVDAAVVRLTRWVAGQSASLDTTTDAEGRFDAGGLVGGLWSAVAWRAPDIKPGAPVSVFATRTAVLSFTIVSADVELPSLTLERAGTDQTPGSFDVVATLTGEVVGTDGSVTPAGVNAEVAIDYPEGHSGPAAVELPEGSATFTVACDPGARPGTLQASVGDSAASLALPACPSSPDPAPSTTTSTTVAVSRPPVAPDTPGPGQPQRSGG